MAVTRTSAGLKAASANGHKADANDGHEKLPVHFLNPGEVPPTGVRIYSDGIDPEKPQNFFVRLVAQVTLALYTGWLNVMLCFIIGSFFNRVCLYITLALFSTLLLPCKPVLWPAFNRLWIFKTWRHYFHYSMVIEEVLDHSKRYVFVEFPHGAFPIGAIVAGTLMQTLFPDLACYSVAASSVFAIPGWRHFITWIGSVPASAANFKRLLQKGSVAVVVGGIAEMYMGDPKVERIKLKGRRGFAKIALEEQVDGIIPVYYFGQSKVLDFGPKCLSSISRKLRTSLGYMTGWMGLPVPRPLPILMVNGKVIPVPKMARDDPAFDTTVDALLENVIAEVYAMYDRHKAEYGWADRPLSIE